MSNLRSAEAHLLELRKIHSMLHAAMDALIKDLNANDSARILILLDDRLTSLINSAEIEREPSSARAVGDEAAARQTAPAAAPPPVRDTVKPGASAPRPAVAESPSGSTVPHGAPAPERKSVEPVPGPKAAPESTPDAAEIPVTPIMAVPPEAAIGRSESLPGHQAFPSFEDIFASTAGLKVESKVERTFSPPPKDAPKPAETVSAPPAQAASAPVEAAPALESSPKSEFKPEPSPEPDHAAPMTVAAAAAALVPEPAIPSVAQPGEPEIVSAAEDADEDDEWIEEDFEEGEDLDTRAEVEVQPVARKVGFAGLLSKLRLPGLGRRNAEVVPDDEPAFEPDPEDDRLDAAEDEELAAPEIVSPAFTANLRRLHEVAGHIAASQLLAEAEARTGSEIELRVVDDGLDLVVKGLPNALGTVRLSDEDGHALYHPRFGLDLPGRAPNRADLELWTKTMGDLVVQVLEDIAKRRRSRAGGTEAGG